MIDNVKLFIPRCRDMPDVVGYLDSGIEQNDITTGETRLFGKVGNVRVIQSVGGYSIQGSLPKFLNGNNIVTLNRHTIKEALEKLSDTLHLDMNISKVTGLEFGDTFVMSKQPSAYINLLGNMPRLERRLGKGDTLYYIGKGRVHPREYYFYDKKKEVLDKGGTLPNGYESLNLLRYEMRLNNRLPKTFRVVEVSGAMLYDGSFIHDVSDMWVDGYKSITKLSGMNDECLKGIKSPKDAVNLLLAKLIGERGGDTITDYLNTLKSAKVFSDPKQYTRVKAKLDDVSSQKISPDSKDVGELSDSILNSTAFL